jgi:hypothetical protein
MTTPTDHPVTPPTAEAIPAAASSESAPAPTFVKLAMRNMVYQGSKSIFHFALTTVGLLGLLVGLAFITR